MTDRTGGACWGPTWRFKIGAYEFGRYRREHRNDGRLWEASRHGRGVGGCRTPVGAFFALRRFLKEPPRAI